VSTALLPDHDLQAASLPGWWRRRPTVLRGAVPPGELPPDPAAAFASWCVPPAVARLYRLVGEADPGAAGAARVPVGELLDRGEALRRRGRPVTLLLNRVDSVDAGVRGLRSLLPVDLPWRLDDTVATWSDPGSGIGFHSGHEDGFVVQLAGARRWSAWPPETLPDEHHLSVLGRPGGDDAPLRRCPDLPELTVELRAGDALHLPALWPHEGQTIGDGPSLSLSIAWRGVNARRLLAGHVDQRTAAALGTAWYRLLPDVAAGDADRLADLVVPLAATLGIGPDDVVAAVDSLLDGAPLVR
jgi:ribosomal protein L16 Arg81 hydroxylase